MSEPDHREALAAARAAFALGAASPSAVALIRRGPVKETFLVETAAELVVMCRYRDIGQGRQANAALAAAHDAALGPRPLGSTESPELGDTGAVCWVGYQYAAGPSLESRQDLVEVYATLGRLAGECHARFTVPAAPAALSRFDHPIVPSDVREAARALANGAQRLVTLHGDLNASNVVLSHRAVLIDFDEVCRGPPEFDLALALAYVNTRADDVRACLSAVISGYAETGMPIQMPAVRSWLELMPWYMTAAQHARMGALDLQPFSAVMIQRQEALVREAFGFR